MSFTPRDGIEGNVRRPSGARTAGHQEVLDSSHLSKWNSFLSKVRRKVGGLPHMSSVGPYRGPLSTDDRVSVGPTTRRGVAQEYGRDPSTQLCNPSSESLWGSNGRVVNGRYVTRGLRCQRERDMYMWSSVVRSHHRYSYEVVNTLENQKGLSDTR